MLAPETTMALEITQLELVGTFKKPSGDTNDVHSGRSRREKQGVRMGLVGKKISK